MAGRTFRRRDLIVVILAVGLLAAVFLPAMNRAKHMRWRLECADNLKQVGLGFRTWVIDGGVGSPGHASTNGTESVESIAGEEAYRYFQRWSNALASPKLFVCPADVRAAATNFGPGLSNTNLSYFICPDAEETQPQLFLCGDRNLTNGLPIVNGVLPLPPGRPVGWTHEMHNRQGNVGLADGSVQGASNSRLTEALAGTTNRLLMP